MFAVSLCSNIELLGLGRSLLTTSGRLSAVVYITFCNRLLDEANVLLACQLAVKLECASLVTVQQSWSEIRRAKTIAVSNALPHTSNGQVCLACSPIDGLLAVLVDYAAAFGCNTLHRSKRCRYEGPHGPFPQARRFIREEVPNETSRLVGRRGGRVEVQGP